uniref:Uncharacterized protein AlNc14C186G8320 n=1 Tax=Albugo laibachii Nc14 TaxID=890382 RepID=F0WPH5_9STRA|nr:conserved hypothetical protein [Albugo laibachii Nc14]|eukprot:CCA23223.1 conserved hypothetical protein [Albugo laibachii Nc14]
MHQRTQRLVASLLCCYVPLSDCDPKLTRSAQSHDKVEVKIRYRTFCAACQSLITSVIIPIIKDESFREIVTFRLLPIGGMSIQDSHLVCEDGISECLGHRWHACFLEQADKEPYVWLEKVACLEGFKSGDLENWDANVAACVLPTQLKSLAECWHHRSEKILEKLVADEADGQARWLPHITLDKKLVGTATASVGFVEFKQELCRAYKADSLFYPNECNRFPGLARNTPDSVATPGTAPNKNRLRNSHVKIVKLDMKVYWRAHCPASRMFMVEVLPRILNDKGFQQILNFHSLHGAGTSLSPSGQFVCSSGDEECNAHKWLSCITSEIRDLTAQLKHIICVENYQQSTQLWKAISANCTFKSDSGEALQTCFSTKSSAILKKIVEQVEDVNPAWMPLVVLDGKKIGDSEVAVNYKLILQEICSAYKGDTKMLPAACNDQLLQNMNPEKAPVKPCKPKQKRSTNTKTEYMDPPDIGPRHFVKQALVKEATLHAKPGFGRELLPPDMYPIANMQMVLIFCVTFVVFCAAWYLRSRKKAHHF